MILLISATTPNSDKSAENAPAITAMAMIKNTVSKSKACDVSIIVENILSNPITEAT